MDTFRHKYNVHLWRFSTTVSSSTSGGTTLLRIKQLWEWKHEVSWGCNQLYILILLIEAYTFFLLSMTQFLLVDLRCHGDSASLKNRGPHNVASAALDVLKLVCNPSTDHPHIRLRELIWIHLPFSQPRGKVVISIHLTIHICLFSPAWCAKAYSSGSSWSQFWG